MRLQKCKKCAKAQGCKKVPSPPPVYVYGFQINQYTCKGKSKCEGMRVQDRFFLHPDHL